MTEDAVRPIKQTERPARFLPRRLTEKLDERHMPATPTLDRLVDEIVQRPMRRMRLRKTLSSSRKTLADGLTVLVPTRDRGGIRLANLLASLEAQSVRQEMRVMVIDYGSAENEAREIAQLAKRSAAQLVRIEAEAWNRSAALNAGLRRVRTKFVLVADADLTFDPRYVEKALGLLREDPLRIVVSAMHDLPEMTSEAFSAASFEELRGMARPRFDAKYHPSIIAAHRLAFATVGSYDEEYRGWGLEDVDLFTRLRNAGLDPVDAGAETGYLHQWHPKYLGQTDAAGAFDANRHRFDGKRSARAGQRKAIVAAAGPRMWHLLERYALPTFQRFADRFGYDLLVSRLEDEGDESDRRKTNAARWAKVALLREAIETYDIAVWLDADVMICRFDDDVASHLAEDKFQAFVMEQVPQDQRINPNTGVWLLRGGSRSRRFLRAVEHAGSQRGPWADQATVMKMLGWDMGGPIYRAAGPGSGSRFLRGTGWLPPSWNQLYSVPGEELSGVYSVPRVNKPHALHFAGLRIADREIFMRQTLERIMEADLVVPPGPAPRAMKEVQ